jgi:diacylglycerol kinase family enzyme
VTTERPGHATHLAAGAVGYAGILVAGGDGTVFEVLQGMNRATQRLAILPVGRGNSLARDLIAEPQCIDLMEVIFEDAHGNSRRVLSASTVALGYPVDVAELANRRLRFLGPGGYAAATVLTRTLLFNAQVSYDGREVANRRLTGLLVNNTQHVANFLALPRASCRDGVIEAMELRAGFVAQTLHNLSALARWSYEPAPPISVSRARVSLEQPRSLLIDGELYPAVVSLQIEVLASAVTCARSV